MRCSRFERNLPFLNRKRFLLLLSFVLGSVYCLQVLHRYRSLQPCFRQVIYGERSIHRIVHSARLVRIFRPSFHTRNSFLLYFPSLQRSLTLAILVHSLTTLFPHFLPLFGFFQDHLGLHVVFLHLCQVFLDYF